MEKEGDIQDYSCKDRYPYQFLGMRRIKIINAQRVVQGEGRESMKGLMKVFPGSLGTLKEWKVVNS